MAISKVPPRSKYRNGNSKIPSINGKGKEETRLCGNGIKNIIVGTFISCPRNKTSQPIMIRCDNLRIMNGFPTGKKYLPEAILEARQRKINFTITNKDIISKLANFNISLSQNEIG